MDQPLSNNMGTGLLRRRCVIPPTGRFPELGISVVEVTRGGARAEQAWHRKHVSRAVLKKKRRVVCAMWLAKFFRCGPEQARVVGLG